MAGSAAAQYHFPVSTEASFGFRVGHGGTYTTRSGAAIDVVLGYRLRDTPAGTLIGAFNLGVQSPVTTSGPGILLPNGEEAPIFPMFFSGGALLGIQRGSARTASARILAGPTYYLPLGSLHDAGGALGGYRAERMFPRRHGCTPPWSHRCGIPCCRVFAAMHLELHRSGWGFGFSSALAGHQTQHGSRPVAHHAEP